MGWSGTSGVIHTEQLGVAADVGVCDDIIVMLHLGKRALARGAHIEGRGMRDGKRIAGDEVEIEQRAGKKDEARSQDCRSRRGVRSARECMGWRQVALTGARVNDVDCGDRQ
jgi:hypothetical protein